MREWILGVFAASVLSAMAPALCPKGRVYAVTKFACGLVCAMAVASPLLTLDMDSLAAGLAEYRAAAQSITEKEEEAGNMMERIYIQDRCAAYICAKAAELGAALSGAEVLARWDDEALLWYPWSVSMDGARNAALADAVERDLGIPPERQEWAGDGD